MSEKRLMNLGKDYDELSAKYEELKEKYAYMKTLHKEHGLILASCMLQAGVVQFEIPEKEVCMADQKGALSYEKNEKTGGIIIRLILPVHFNGIDLGIENGAETGTMVVSQEGVRFFNRVQELDDKKN